MESARRLLQHAGARLAAAGLPNPDLDAELLLSHVTGRPRLMLRLAGATVDAAQAARFDECLDLRARRVPLQHITGRAAFRHIELRVGPGVFIPRPETEVMVDAALDALRHRPRRASEGATPGRPLADRGPGRDTDTRSGPLIVDLCTGSGALALSLAVEAPGSRVVAVELSEPALGWAQGNIADHEGRLTAARSSVELVLADATRVADPGGALVRLRGQVDLVITNPPYIPVGAVPRDPEVRDHDPDMALYGGADGLDVVRPLARQAALLLNQGGLLLVEHADAQGEEAGVAGVPWLLRDMHDDDGGPTWCDVADHVDLAGRPRFTSARRAVRAAAGPIRTGSPDEGAVR
ncbi:MAG: HemK/PrmC family methyltransferase [Candidatus Nanopelagicales bacterium]